MVLDRVWPARHEVAAETRTEITFGWREHDGDSEGRHFDLHFARTTQKRWA